MKNIIGKTGAGSIHNLVATIRRLLSRPDARIVCLKVAIVLGCMSGFLLSRKLWVTTRFFPLIPIVHGLPRIPFPLDYIYFVGLLLLLALVGLSSKPRLYILIFVILTLILGALDQSRWQPWAYQYVFMLAAIGFFSWEKDDTQGRDNALNMCRLIVATIYLYSGLQKATPQFVFHVFPDLMGTMIRVPESLQALGWIAPLAEMGIGIGLLTKRFRDTAVVGGAAMHWFILLALGPLGHIWNSVVWPWNVAMITFLFLLFWKAEFSFWDVIWGNRCRFQKVILLLFGIMPIFSFFGWWDSYLSSSLYSGNITLANIFVSNAVRDNLPDYIRGYVTHLEGSNNVLEVAKWSFGELNVPAYPEMRVYRAIGADICNLTNNSPDVALYTQGKSTLLGGGNIRRDTCFSTLIVKGW